jgi:serine/threonine protein kinase
MTTPRHTFTALGGSFTVDGDYTYVKELGQGAYGLVVAARHRRTGEGCAIKKITNINTKVRASVRPRDGCRLSEDCSGS